MRFSRPRDKLQNGAPCNYMEVSRRGRKQGNLGELNLEALLEPCRLLVLGGSLNTSKEVINKNFDISL